MAKAPDARMEQARALFLEGKKLIEISELLKIPEGTVRSWKNRYKWDCSVANEKCNVAKRKRGAQPGNKNSSGGPLGNKKAVTTGEFETLLFDCLDPEERQLAQAVPEDKMQLLLQEIQLLTVRERRMLKRIELLRKSADEVGATLYGDSGMTVVSRKIGIEKGEETDLLEYQGKLGQIQSVEDALTRVQARKQRAIEALHKFGYDDARLELETMKIELTALKLGGQDTEVKDDGFMTALNGAAGSLWGDENDSD